MRQVEEESLDLKDLSLQPFTVQELSTLIREVRGNYEYLFGATSTKLSLLVKNHIWECIQRNINRVGQSQRTIADVKSRWKDIELQGERWFNFLSAEDPKEKTLPNAEEQNIVTTLYDDGQIGICSTDVSAVTYIGGDSNCVSTGHTTPSHLGTITETEDENCCNQESAVIPTMPSANAQTMPSCATPISPEKQTNDHSANRSRSQPSWKTDMATLQTQHTDMLTDMRKDIGVVYSDLQSFSMQMFRSLNSLEKHVVAQQQTLRQLEAQNRVLWVKQLEIANRTENTEDLLGRLADFLSEQRPDCELEPVNQLGGPLMTMQEEMSPEEILGADPSQSREQFRIKKGGKRKTKSMHCNEKRRK